MEGSDQRQRERAEVDASYERWRGAIRGGGKRSEVEGTIRVGGDPSEVGASNQRWRGAIRFGGE